ncbi:MAG: hypothetical protein J6D57_05800 [Mogibacterium sp.]|nr:hypothetical protein [Mogibacterium sp.]
MKLTAKGIGWLIAGLIICASATESYGIAAKLSTIALGLVFVAVYLMKQIFVPRGIGWFIAGGVLVAFVVEEGLSEEGWISVGIAAACLMVFYFRNKDGLEAASGGTIEYYPDEETGDESVDPNAAPAYDPDAAPGEDPYAMPDSPAEEYQEPERPDEGDDPSGGGSADSTSSGSSNTGSDEVVDFEIDMKE